MDEIVLRGMAKWPNVPSVYGWLSLDRRGQWLLKGERVTNPGITDFFARNYSRDDAGRWFVQNGPQRVFVRLEYTPFVFRLASEAPAGVQVHTGTAVSAIRQVHVDEQGNVLLDTDLGAGVIHDADLDAVVSAFRGSGGRTLDDNAIDAALVTLQSGRAAAQELELGQRTYAVTPINSGEIASRYGFNPRPLQPAGEEECY